MDDPSAPGERGALVHFLEAQRQAVLDIVDGISEEDSRRSLVPSGWTVLSLLVHLGDVERHWFSYVLGGDYYHAPVLTRDPETLDEAVEAYRAEIVKSRGLLDNFVPDDPLTCIPEELPGELVVVRDALPHVIEEVARHCGHLDLARELLDGTRSLTRFPGHGWCGDHAAPGVAA